MTAPFPTVRKRVGIVSQRESTATGAIDLSKLLEFGPWTGVRLAVVVLGAAGFLIYGSTAQLLGLAIPVLVKEWHLTRGAFVPVVVGGLATISLGSIFAGALGDKFGPKRTLGASMLLVALATAAGALSNSLPWFVLARIIAGLGIGGTMPNAISLIAEYAPKKYNSNIILAAAIFTPIGGIMAGYLAALEESGVSWRALFMICAAVSAIAALGSMVLVPESARFLFPRPSRRIEFHKVMRRLGVRDAAQASFTDSAPHSGVASPIFLLKSEYRWNTLAICASFIFITIIIYMLYSWLPAGLSAQGLRPRSVGQDMVAFNVGGIGGAALSVALIGRFSTRLLLILSGTLGTGVALALMVFPPVANGALWYGAMGALLFCAHMNFVFSAVIAIAVQLFPPSLRATGMGLAYGSGKLVAVAAVAGGNAVLNFGGLSALFGTCALLLALGFVCALFIRTRSQIDPAEA